MKINGENVNKMYCNGYKIIRAYGCDGKLVFGNAPQREEIEIPTGTKFYGIYNDGSTISIPCNASTKLSYYDDYFKYDNDGSLWKVETAYIGDCVEEIEENFFNKTGTTNNTSCLTSVTISNNVKKIGYGFCQGCEKLVNIEFPDNVSEIPSNCFYDCKSLSTFNIKEGVTIIGTEAFGNCPNLLDITIPSTVKEIKQSAFHVQNEYNIQRKVTCLATTPPTLGYIVFSAGAGEATYPIYVPSESLEDYKNAWGDKINVNRIKPIE